MKAADVEVDCVIYNTALATCVSADKADEARSLLDSMDGVRGVAEVITYNTLLMGYAKSGAWINASSFTRACAREESNPLR
jgi:pentatricopeptide repeat protein